MFEKFIVTEHAKIRYRERVSETNRNLMKRLNYDLHFKQANRIINIGNYRHVFARNSKEFIFVRDGAIWVLKTVIKRTREDNQRAINKRLAQAGKLQLA